MAERHIATKSAVEDQGKIQVNTVFMMTRVPVKCVFYVLTVLHIVFGIKAIIYGSLFP